jgi:DNA-binding MarR family transcriptional regulator
MDEKTKELIDELVRYALCVKLLKESSLTKKQHEALWELEQKGIETLGKLIDHLKKEEAK